MMELLANLYYDDGKDREAALAYNFLIKREAAHRPRRRAGRAEIVDCVLRAGQQEADRRADAQAGEDHRATSRSRGQRQDRGRTRSRWPRRRSCSERTLSNLAVNWHNEAPEDPRRRHVRVRQRGLRRLPGALPGQPEGVRPAVLLGRAPQRQPAASTTRPQQQYTLVVDAGRAKAIGRQAEAGQVAAQLRLQRGARLRRGGAPGRAEGRAQAPERSRPQEAVVPSAPQRKGLLDACERYLKYLPKGEKRVEIAYKAAKHLLPLQPLRRGGVRFSEIALNRPDHKFENGDRAGEIAANLVLDSYNLLEDYAKVNEWARRFYANDKLATGQVQATTWRRSSSSRAFKLVSQLEEKKEYAQGGRGLPGLRQGLPARRRSPTRRSTTPPSTTTTRKHAGEGASQARERLIRKYPRSSAASPPAIYANAEAQEAIGDFEHAAEHLRAVRERLRAAARPAEEAPRRPSSKQEGQAGEGRAEEPKEEGPKWEESKAQIALFNAGVYREGLGQLKQALKDRERYLELWPKAKDAETVALSIADLHERMNQYGKAVAFLEQTSPGSGARLEQVPRRPGPHPHIYRGPEAEEPEGGRPPAEDDPRVLRQALPEAEGRARAAREGSGRAAPSTRRTRSSSSTTPARSSTGARAADPVKGFRDSIKDKGKSLDEIRPPLHQTWWRWARPSRPSARSGDRPGLREHGGHGGQRADAPRAPARGAGGSCKNEFEQQAQPIRRRPRMPSPPRSPRAASWPSAATARRRASSIAHHLPAGAVPAAARGGGEPAARARTSSRRRPTAARLGAAGRTPPSVLKGTAAGFRRAGRW